MRLCVCLKNTKSELFFCTKSDLYLYKSTFFYKKKVHFLKFDKKHEEANDSPKTVDNTKMQTTKNKK